MLVQLHTQHQNNFILNCFNWWIVKAQFLANGGTEAAWNAIVMPESSGNPNASNGQYHGLGQTNQSWGTGSVASQTQG